MTNDAGARTMVIMFRVDLVWSCWHMLKLQMNEDTKTLNYARQTSCQESSMVNVWFFVAIKESDVFLLPATLDSLMSEVLRKYVVLKGSG